MQIINLVFFWYFLFTINPFDNVYEIRYKYSQEIEINSEERRFYPPDILEQIVDAGNQSYEFLLYTDETRSLIKLQSKIINSQSELGIEIEPDLKWVYKDLSENYFVNKIEFNKGYYVKDSIEKLNFQETKDEKYIINFKTKKYFFEDENRVIEIWCADEIKIPNGPLNYSGNKTLILETTISNKKAANFSYHFIATEINYPTQYNFNKEMPKKIITKQEFDKIFSEHKNKEKEMKESIEM